jgi:hypothetical protein
MRGARKMSDLFDFVTLLWFVEAVKYLYGNLQRESKCVWGRGIKGKPLGPVIT